MSNDNYLKIIENYNAILKRTNAIYKESLCKIIRCRTIFVLADF